MTKPRTDEEALGPQNKGVWSPPLDDKQRSILYEYRMDVLRKIDPRLGLQFVPDPVLPWLRDDRVKLNLGPYKNFGSKGWINIAGTEEERREFNMPLDELRLAEGTVDFIYAPFVLQKLDDPLRALKNWRHSLKSTGMICAVIEDRELKIRTGSGKLGNEGKIPDLNALQAILEEARYVDLVRVDFRVFSICGEEPYYSGLFAFKA